LGALFLWRLLVFRNPSVLGHPRRRYHILSYLFLLGLLFWGRWLVSRGSRKNHHEKHQDREQGANHQEVPAVTSLTPA
jgi:hypothetical protein